MGPWKSWCASLVPVLLRGQWGCDGELMVTTTETMVTRWFWLWGWAWR